jgi:hypothetical protein
LLAHTLESEEFLMTSWLRRRGRIVWAAGALAVAGTVAALLAGCGATATGDVEGQVLAMRDATTQPALLKGAGVVLAGNGIDCGTRADRCVTQTDEAGKYRFAGVPAGDYGIAFNPPKDHEPPLQAEARQFNVSPNAVETVSVVLLAEGMARPTVPAELAQRGAAARNDPGLMSNPFFWYFMFNQPWLGGYTRPPVVVYGPDRNVVVDRSQPAPAPGRTYTNYGPPGSANAKPPPAAIDSKGVTRPGGSAALPGGGAGASPALPDGSKGVARPGQAPSGADRATVPAPSRKDSPSLGSRDSTSPPRISPGGSGARRSSPPRVRVGRR